MCVCVGMDVNGSGYGCVCGYGCMSVGMDLCEWVWM